MTNLYDLIDEIKTALDYDSEHDLLPCYTLAELGPDIPYRTPVKSLTGAELFNYHSDYWGTAEQYQEQNITAMTVLEPYIGEEIECDGKVVTLVAMLIDKQYNGIGHTALLIK